MRLSRSKVIGMIKRSIGACLLLFVCLSMMEITLTQAQVTVGVSEGDVFEYNFYSTWHSDFMDTPPAELVELNQTEWVRVTVTEVSGSQIKTIVTTHHRNGTEENADGFCDIETGETTVSPPFISANLNTFDPINPSATIPYYVNETLVGDYANSQRETNLLRFEQTDVLTDVGATKSITEYYFDKDTGALVEYSMAFSYTGLTSITRSKLISSNVWVIPEFPSWIILPLFSIVALSVIALKRKASKLACRGSRPQ